MLDSSVVLHNVDTDLIKHFILNNHQLKAGGLKIGGLNRRLKENAAESRWFVPQAERPSGGLKPPYGNQSKSMGCFAATQHVCNDSSSRRVCGPAFGSLSILLRFGDLKKWQDGLGITYSSHDKIVDTIYSIPVREHWFR